MKHNRNIFRFVSRGISTGKIRKYLWRFSELYNESQCKCYVIENILDSSLLRNLLCIWHLNKEEKCVVKELQQNVFILSLYSQKYCAKSIILEKEKIFKYNFSFVYDGSMFKHVLLTVVSEFAPQFRSKNKVNISAGIFVSLKAWTEMISLFACFNFF